MLYAAALGTDEMKMTVGTALSADITIGYALAHIGCKATDHTLFAKFLESTIDRTATDMLAPLLKIAANTVNSKAGAFIFFKAGKDRLPLFCVVRLFHNPPI